MAKNSADVIVIGAGVSGLSAAFDLRKAGNSVIVLEGRDRIGGRQWTERKWKDAPMDMGASWITGVDGNPVTELAQKFNIKTIPSDDESVSIFTQDGEEFSDEEFDELDSLYKKMMKSIDQKRKNLKKDTSFQFMIEEFMKENELSAKEQKHLWFYICNLIESDYSDDSKELSALYWDADDGFDGNDAIFPNGYDEIAQNLAKGTDIRLNNIVNEISYNEDGVTVKTNQDTYKAECAVVTLPLGVLKKGTVKFHPPLPKRKQEAIQNLKMGLLNKLYLKFPKVFWPKKTEQLLFMDDQKKDNLDMINFYLYTEVPILLFFTYGEDGRNKESLSDKELIDQTMKSLKKIFGNDIPEPVDYLRTNWQKDEFAYGSYSYIPVGASPDDYDALAESVDDVLFFAGEATTVDYSGTIHGALISGQDAAEEILSE